MYYIDAADDSNARTAECMRKMYAMQQNKGILCDVTLKVPVLRCYVTVSL